MLPHGTVGVAPVPDDLTLDAHETLQQAQRLLDQGCPFQAHEILEARWKTGPQDERDYWQGLAQAAVALTHLRRGNLAGARRLALRAQSHLETSAAPSSAAATPDICRQLDEIAAGTDAGLTIAGDE